jgi:hypothetical protein
MKNSTVLTKLFPLLLLSVLTLCISNLSAQSSNDWFNPDTVKAGRFDTGKMWTFEYPPTDYFKEAYDFIPTQEWYEHVRFATLKFATYCSASFVSADGLIMTNHHCARESVTEITKEGEDLHNDGFIALTLEDERPVPGLFVEQCIEIKDVTEEIYDALEESTSEEDRLNIESEKISEIESRYENDDDGIFAQVTPLYFGGKYSLYIYKRYSDVRLVFAPESQAGYFGGDYDNFTYPRYNLDCTFFRVYDDEGNPLKVDHYFKWSEKGAVPGEAVFVTGNPGSTNRLNIVAELEYSRDITYPQTIEMVESFIKFLEQLIKDDPERSYDLSDQLLNYYNSAKAYKGMLQGLQDEVLMQKKRDFEKNFKAKIQSDPELNEKYGDLWDNIESILNELRGIIKEQNAISYSSPEDPEYFFLAQELIAIAEELRLSESERLDEYIGSDLNDLVETLNPNNYDIAINKELLKNKIELLYLTLGEDSNLVKKFTNGKRGNEAVEDILSRTYLTSFDKIKEAVADGPDAILKSGDPFIDFIRLSDEAEQLIDIKTTDIYTKQDIYNQMLGRALFEVYGTSIPPDATFTLRLTDGVVKGFPYNGTIAPPITTFYGMYDRYYSFDGKFPWELHERWLNPPPDFDLSTPFNFVSTNDVVGGNSGSPIINKDAEIVGVAFDGNIQSLPGDFIYDPEVNRSVGVHSAGMLEAIKDLYKFKRLAEELVTGNLDE